MGKFDDNIIPNQPPKDQRHEFRCFQCGQLNYFIRPESFFDYKEEAERLQKRLNDMIHDLNETMSFSERHYSMNPYKEKLIQDLLKIRQKYE